jgi:hypothetical protein
MGIELRLLAVYKVYLPNALFVTNQLFAFLSLNHLLSATLIIVDYDTGLEKMFWHATTCHQQHAIFTLSFVFSPFNKSLGYS